ncbi:MAG TPA: phage tail tape measure protein, partial [Candidatus Glassbacteria bacterium]|nr:phage tail tape measure protein [Candidatus Glassbacteria bacterium]
MADSTSTKIIQYIAEIGDVINKLNAIDAKSQQVGKNLGTNFTRSIDVVQKGLGSIGSKEIAKPTKDGIKTINESLQSTSSIIKDSDGAFKKFTETTRENSEGLKVVTKSSKDLSEAQQKSLGLINPLIGKSSQLGTNFSKLTDVNAKFSKELAGVGQASFIVKNGLTSVSGDTSKFSSVVATADGKILQLNETITRTPDGLQKVNRSVKDLTDQYNKQGQPVKDLDKNTVSLGENIARLAKRAALTIPLWLVLRGAVTGVISTFKNGLKDINDFDRALQKLRRNLSATSTDLEGDFKTIKDAIVDFSVRSGESVEDITNAIQRFATVGFTLEESLKGGVEATKLAVTLFGDAEETANAFARSLRVLTENVTDSGEKQRLIGEALAFTDKLWKTNAFEVKEFSGNLQKFAGTANIANLSINDTIALLATLSTGGLANRAGRLLRSTLLKSLADIDKINQQLQLGFDPKNQTTIDFILLMVQRLQELRTVGNVPAELADTLGELFSVRGTEVVAALTSLEKTLKANIALRPDVQGFEKDFEDQTEQVNRLTKRITNLNKEFGRAFVAGVVGGDDFTE